MEVARHRAAALDEQLHDALGAEVVEQRREVTGRLRAGPDLRVIGHGPEDDAAGGGPATLREDRWPVVPHGEGRVVAADGAGPDQDGVGLGAEAVAVGPGGR